MRPRHRHAKSADDCDSLASYLQEIGAYRMLDQSEELELATRIQAGDEDALNQLVCANLRFVVAVAKKYQNQGVPLADLINEGNLGLVRAASRFDGGKGVKFISYAVWWIRRAMLQAISDNGHAVRIPLARVGAAHRIRRRANGLRQALGREPSQHEVAEEMHIGEDEVETSFSVVSKPISLDAPRGNSATTTLLDLLPDTSDADGEEQGMADALSFPVQEAMEQLRERERYVLRLYFGFDAPNTMTLDEIAARLGITRERVRQIKDRALSRLKKAAVPHAAGSRTMIGVR
jgi:RNA polymerase primary sigma factor